MFRGVIKLNLHEEISPLLVSVVTAADVNSQPTFRSEIIEDRLIEIP